MEPTANGVGAEIEAKFLLDSTDQADAILQAVGADGWRAAEEPTRRIVDTYLDTADRRLAGAGVSCRIRLQDDRVFVTWKTRAAVAGAVHARREWERELDRAPADPNAVRQGPIAAGLDGLLGAEPLGELLTIRTTRRPFRLEAADGAAAELVVDDVHASAPDGSASAKFCELEIELKGGDSGRLARLADHLRRALGLAPSGVNKLRRALGLLGRL